MSRAIKFRAWYKKLKRMYRVLDIDLEHQMIACPCQDGCETGIDGFYLDEGELMQFTGLVDSSGKDIYEGDIVSNGDWRGVVEYSTTCAGGYKPFACDGEGDHECRHNWGDYWEVIGNIYEHADLLEVQS